MIAWIILFSLFVVLIGFDMLILHKKNAIVSHKKAALETFFWVSFAMLFSIGVYLFYKNGLVKSLHPIRPGEAVSKYITGYLIELSLSIDNLFVIATIFAAQKVPLKYQHRVLYWGIAGAIVLRAIMIYFGIALIERFKKSYVYPKKILHIVLTF